MMEQADLHGLVTALPPHVRERILRAAQPADNGVSQHKASPPQPSFYDASPSIRIPSALTSTAVSVHDDVIDHPTIEVLYWLPAPPATILGIRLCMVKHMPCSTPTARGDTRVWITPSLLADNAHPTLCALAASLSRHLPPALRAEGLLQHPGHLSMQLARYPGLGEGYVTHRDRSEAAPNRLFTVVLYLSLEWNEGHGGCLRLFHSPTESPSAACTVVPPLPGRLVCFPAHLPHQVQPCHAPRLALTAWVCTAPPHPQPRPTPPPPWTMFVSIVAYRDPETTWTLRELFSKAAHPAGLRVGVVWQLRLPEDAALLTLACGWEGAVRQVVVGAHEASGPCAARAMAAGLYRGETFALQIDAHCRFSHGWDAALVGMLRQAEQSTDKAVLSTYPAAYRGSGPSAVCDEDTAPIALVASHFDSDGMLRCRGRRLDTPRLPAPLPAVWWAAGFSFSRGSLLREVPYLSTVPGLFFGEEPVMLLRMWLAGWDVFCPTHTVVFHQWSRAHRPTPCSDGIVNVAERATSQAYVRALLAGREQPHDITVMPARTLKAFYEHTGVDFAAQRIEERGWSGGVPSSVAFAGDNGAAVDSGAAGKPSCDVQTA